MSYGLYWSVARGEERVFFSAWTSLDQMSAPNNSMVRLVYNTQSVLDLGFTPTHRHRHIHTHTHTHTHSHEFLDRGDGSSKNCEITSSLTSK